MEKKLEIKKLADVVVWADNLITAAGFNQESYKSDSATAYCYVKAYELWKIKEVALESINRHNTYTNALNKDIADKAAKIDLLEKEIEGRKEGYTALKELMDTKYIPIDEHNDICKAYEKKVTELEKELADCKVKIRHQKENLDGINKTLEIRTKENESLIRVRNNQTREIEAHEAENARLSETIINLRKEQKTLVDICDKYKKENGDYAIRVNNLQKELEEYKDLKTNNAKRRTEIIELRDKVEELEKQNEYLTKELEQTYKDKETDLKNHNKRDMTLVDELAGKNDKIKNLVQEVEYYKNQERIRTDQLRATESKVEELYKQIEGLTDNCRSKSTEIARLRKEMADIKHELGKEDDHGRAGFKKYIEWLIEEEERAVPDRFKERLNEEITEIFEKEEETEVKDVKEPIVFDEYHKYNWFPCGKDSIE